MKLIHQLIGYFQSRGVLTARHLEQLTADGFFGSPRPDDDIDDDYDRRQQDHDYYKALVEEERQRKEDALQGVEAGMDRKHLAHSRVRKTGGGQKAKARKSRDFGPALAALSQRIATGLANAGALLEPLCRFEPIRGRTWQDAAAGISERTDDELDAHFSELLQKRAIDADALWKLLAVDLPALAGSGRGVVVRAFHTLLGQPDSMLPVRTKWDHRLLTQEALKQAVVLNMAQIRLTRAWGKLCLQRPDLPFAALQANPNELGLWTLALLHTAQRRFQLGASFLWSNQEPSSRHEPTQHVCPPELWKQAWTCALRSESTHVVPLLLWLDRDAGIGRGNESFLNAPLVGPPGWNIVMHEAIKRRRKKLEAENE